MKRFLLALAFLLSLASMSYGDGLRTFSTSVVAADAGVQNSGTGIGFHKITWNPSGTVSTCQVQVDSSSDGVTWTAAGVIASQLCTSAGTTAISSGVFNFIRINVTAITGGGSVSATWNGYNNNPGAGSGTPGGSAGQAQYNANGTSLGGTPAQTLTGTSPITGVQTANNLDVWFSKRFTDTSPTGNFLHFQTAAAADLFVLDITGTITVGIVPYVRLSSFPAACGANLFATQIAATPGCTQPSFTNLSGTASAAQLGSAHNILGALACADTSASGTAQVCNTTPTFTPVTGDCITYTTTTANTGAGLTLNVNSLGAKSVAKWQATTSLAANDVLANKEVLTCYDGTNWELHSIGNAPGGSVNITGTPAANQLAQWTNSNTVKGIDFPDVKYFPAALCVNGLPSTGWSTTGATPSGACRSGTNNKDAFIGPWGTTDVAYVKIHLPKDWDSAANPNLSIDLASNDATNGHTIIMQIGSACAKGDGSTTDDVGFNANQAFSTITLNGTANSAWTATLPGLTMTGCAAPGTLWLKISRAADTATNVEVYGMEITIPRLIVNQAN